MQDQNCIVLAEYHDLTGIFDGAIAAPFHLVQKTIPSDKAFHVGKAAPDNAAFGDGAHREKLLEPTVGSQGGRQ